MFPEIVENHHDSIDGFGCKAGTTLTVTPSTTALDQVGLRKIVGTNLNKNLTVRPIAIMNFAKVVYTVQ